MSDVKRWGVHGEYVMFEDYQSLASRLDIATKALHDIVSRSNPETWPFVRGAEALKHLKNPPDPA